ncbi:hypothetical protein LHP98_14220 [Rhodobacter sp. Har01]|uniref:hypothetical protein n=1 Tax=Rhodobacter sp. Har01 TaxID=2883999 RepID=UPI001D0628E7|nr:hypothetical protein [Rhodobacter sp. Har01]MCB6179276.1 hypothetical protein [Rhodobacter sp. Har01]
MSFVRRALLLLAVAAVVAASPLRAQDLTDKQPSYTRIAAKCGEDPARPSFSAADYAKAMADAAKAIKSAGKEGNRARKAAITESVARLKECMEEETRKFTLPPMRDCRDFLNAYSAFSARAASLIKAGKISEADRARVREMFRKPAMDCVHDMMTKCINPNKTGDVDFVIAVMEAASVFGFIGSYASQTGTERFLTTTNPGFVRMTFCTDTDYACKGNRAACNRRIIAIKAIMQTYMDK